MERQDGFATPIFVREIPDTLDLQRALTEQFTAEAANRPGVHRSVLGGWHSKADLTRRDDPLMESAVELFRYHFEQAVAHLYAGSSRAPSSLTVQLSAWATVLQSGGHSTIHDHGDSHLSAVFWANAGNTDDLSGWLEFVDPRRSSLQLPDLPILEARMRIRPRSGTMVIFPGYLQHFVHPYLGGSTRVSLAANALVSSVSSHKPT